MTALLFFFALWVGYLLVEAARLRRWQAAIPLRIAVTGTRGKSSVARMLAAVLREEGRKVLAKTTGAEPLLFFPDGREQPLRRRGRPSILEQLGVVGLGARMGVDAVVVEVMSVHPENHRIEGQHLLRPHMVLVTNFRVDHLEAQGETEDEVARVLALGVPKGAQVLVPEEEWEEAFEVMVARRGASLVRVKAGERGGGTGDLEFRSNVDLVRAAGHIFGVGEGAVERGIRKTPGDLGSLGAWSYPGTGRHGRWKVVNAFAANDPASTLLAYDRVMAEGGPAPAKPVGLLSLRADRGDRSILWANALSAGALSRFSRLYIHGFHAHAMRRRLKGPDGPEIEILPKMKAPEIMGRVVGGGDGGGEVLFGFGNMGGLGEDLVRHWREVGQPLLSARPEGPGDSLICPSDGGGSHGH